MLQITLDRPRCDVLVVDDDPNFSKALGRWVEMLGYKAISAGSAEEAVAALNKKQPDAVLLDLNLPGVSGHVLLREFAKHQVRVPVVVMSGVGSMDDVIQVMRHNASDYLRKPFTMDQLSGALDRAMASALREKTALDQTVTAQANKSAVPSISEEADESDSDIEEIPIDTRPPPLPEEVEKYIARLARNPDKRAEDLPLVAPNIQDVQALLEDPESNANDIADIVGREVRLTSAVLQVANSRFYRRRQPVTNLRDACVVIGDGRVAAIALEQVFDSVFSSKQAPYRDVLAAMWRNALVCARFGARLASQLAIPQSDDIYVAALLHNIGELVIVQALANDQMAIERKHLRALSQAVGDVHEKVGRGVAKAWGLPPVVVEIAGKHHRAITGRKGSELIRQLVETAWQLSIAAGYHYWPGQKADPSELLSRYGLSHGDVAPWYEESKSWLS